jgi:hypothetical protein
MKAGFFAFEDEGTGETTVVFGTANHVACGSIGCDENAADDDQAACEAKSKVEGLLGDNGYLCEDYLVSTDRSVAECRTICINAGLEELPGLKNCGWG